MSCRRRLVSSRSRLVAAFVGFALGGTARRHLVVVSQKRSAGRVRHVEARELWVQDRVAEGEVSAVKVKGEKNVADTLTKHADWQQMEQYMEACSMVRRSDGHEFCPRLGYGK